MSQIIWITEGQARAIHSKQLALFGGADGILDEGKLSSALARPKHLYTYNQQAHPYELAASLGWGLVKNHPFVDGNKRTAFVVMAVFLKVNGIDLMVPETEVVTTMLASFRWLNVRTGVRGLVVPWVKRHRESRTSPLATV